jgi:hypothetical protein
MMAEKVSPAATLQHFLKLPKQPLNIAGRVFVPAG